jgi:hypothetical protein
MIFGKESRGTAANKEKYLAYIVDRAEEIVDYFWTDIKVAAKALLKHETLTGDEISATIRAARRRSRRRCRVGDPPAFALSSDPPPLRRKTKTRPRRGQRAGSVFGG